MILVAPRYKLLAEARPVDDQTLAWHFVLESVDGRFVLAADDVEPEAPSDRVELLAVVRGLEALDHPARVTLSTPSRYVSHGLRHGLDQWRENGWQWESFGQMTVIKNVDLWKRIDQALAIHRLDCRLLRVDAPTSAVAAPHRPRPARHEREDRRGSNAGLRSSRGLVQQLRTGVSGWLHGLGSLVAPQRAAYGET